MNNINNCNNKDFMEDLTDAMGKLGDGGTRGTDDIISDDKLFKQPPNKDCPICLLRLPLLGSGSAYMACCGKMICCGCDYAPVYDNLGNEIIEAKCPFCRTPAWRSHEDSIVRLQKRVELGDAQAIFIFGSYYRDGEFGFPHDHDKAFELFVRSGELGCNKAYCSVGYAYKNGEGVEIDEKKANHYYKLGAIEGDVHARHNLGCFEAQVGNWERAFKHFMIAVECGFEKSLKVIQKLYTSGHATKEDYAKALRAYQAYLVEIKSTQRNAAAAARANRYY